MTQRVLILAVCFLFCRCNADKRDVLVKDISIGNILVISVPDGVHFFERKGIDSYVAFLVTEKNDTLHIEYGDKGIIYSFHDLNPAVFPLSQKGRIVKASGKEPSSDEIVFSEYADDDREEGVFDKNFFMYDTINKIVVKIIQPKRTGSGITGLYIPRLRDGKSFSIFGRNMDSINSRLALKMFNTIRYKEE